MVRAVDWIVLGAGKWGKYCGFYLVLLVLSKSFGTKSNYYLYKKILNKLIFIYINCPKISFVFYSFITWCLKPILTNFL